MCSGEAWLGGRWAGPCKIMRNCFPRIPAAYQSVCESILPHLALCGFLFYFTSLVGVCGNSLWSSHISYDEVECLCMCLWTITIFPPGRLRFVIFACFFSFPVFPVVFCSFPASLYEIAPSFSEVTSWNKRERFCRCLPCRPFLIKWGSLFWLQFCCAWILESVAASGS